MERSALSCDLFCLAEAVSLVFILKIDTQGKGVNYSVALKVV